jgi:hypothetical protein
MCIISTHGQFGIAKFRPYRRIPKQMSRSSKVVSHAAAPSGGFKKTTIQVALPAALDDADNACQGSPGQR